MRTFRTTCGGWVMATVLWAEAMEAAATGTYLAFDGPPPLRYAIRPRVTAEKKELPPLEMETPVTGSTGPAQESAQVTEIPEETVSTALDSGSAGKSEPIIIPAAAVAPTPMLPGTTITPQVLLSYFGTPGTNGVTPVVMAPVSFIPPQSGSGGSSKATYKTVP